jgi:hypothetical protein
MPSIPRTVVEARRGLVGRPRPLSAPGADGASAGDRLAERHADQGSPFGPRHPPDHEPGPSESRRHRRRLSDSKRSRRRFGRSGISDARDPEGRWRQSNSPSSPPPTWTVARAQAALSDAVCHLLAVVDLLEEVHAGLPSPADIDDRQEGYKVYDVATDVLGTIECVLEDDLRSAIETLLRSATITDDELAQEHRDWLKRKIL